MSIETLYKQFCSSEGVPYSIDEGLPSPTFRAFAEGCTLTEKAMLGRIENYVNTIKNKDKIIQAHITKISRLEERNKVLEMAAKPKDKEIQRPTKQETMMKYMYAFMPPDSVPDNETPF